MKSFFGRYYDNYLAAFLAIFLRFLRCTQMSAFPVCCVVLCSYVCKLLSETVNNIEKNIKMQREVREMFYYFSVMSQNISKCLEEIETALLFFCFSFIAV